MRRFSRAALLGVGGSALAAAGFIASQNAAVSLGGLPVFAGLAALLVAWLQTMAGVRDRRMAEGEGPVLAQLRARLGDDYLYLRRVRFRRQGVEADGLLLGPHGALVLGIRAMPGRFVVRGDDWFADNGRGARELLRHSPTWDVARPVRSLQRMLSEEGVGGVPVQAAVVIVHGQLLEADQPSSAVVPLDRLASYVEYLRPGDPERLRPQVEQLASVLVPAVEAAGGGASRETKAAARR